MTRESGRVRAVWEYCALWVSVVGMHLCAGCCASPDRPSGPPPAYGVVADAYNQRVEGLDRLWARTTVQFRYRDVEGDWRTDQGEGTLQIERPSRVALTVRKLGETLMHVGSDGERYWWFDLTEERRGWVGNQAALSVGGSGGGLPVYPPDVVRLLGIVPIPRDGAETSTMWSEDGQRVGVAVPLDEGGGSVLYWLEPRTFEPERIELLDDSGNVVLYADLLKHVEVMLNNARSVETRVPRGVYIRSPRDESFVRIGLYDPENKAISKVVFDFDRLCRAYGVSIESVEDVDALRESGQL